MIPLDAPDHLKVPTNSALLATAAQWQEAGHGVTIAVVMETWGSSPRPAGSVMIIRDDMAIEGSVSGGCVEANVIEAGLECQKTGVGQRLDFGVADAMAWDVGLSCGGRIAVLLTPVTKCQQTGFDAELLSELPILIDQRQTIRLAVNVTTGVVQQYDGEAETTHLDKEVDQFVFVQAPLTRLIIIGGVHITQFLAPMARQAGYDVVVIDPRSVFITAERLPGIKCVNEWPDTALANMHIDKNTAIVTLTHDPKIDDPALHIALRHDGYYIACLGSRKTHAARCERLAEFGFDEKTIARVNGPAGLDIGARTPSEIAISILAELIMVGRHGEQGTSS